MENYFALIEQRESCRSYTQQPVEREKLVRCVEAARLAPSACNSQPWRYLVVTNPDLCEKLRPCVQGMGMNKFVKDCQAFIVVLEGKATLKETVAMRFKSQDFASIDIGLSVSQLCYAATEQGLSTCILGWLDEKKIKELFSLAEAERVRLVLCVGYAETDKLRNKVRKSMEDIVAFYE